MPSINRTLTAAAPRRLDPIFARMSWDAFRELNGYKAGRPLLTQPGENLKYDKDDAVAIFGISLAQASTSGVANVCTHSTPDCRANCVAGAGNGGFETTKAARALRVRFMLAHPSAFYTLAAAEIDAAAAKYGDRLRVRLNTFSDIRHEETCPWLVEDRPNVRFYDYTKDWQRTTPANYSLTLSASERTTDADVARELANGRNVAIVFDTIRGHDLPQTWRFWPVIDGDKSDNRADDPRGVVVGLRAKHTMRKNSTGMVRKAG